MTVENQVCMLDQAKRLNELGIEQDSSQYAYTTHADILGLFNRREHYRWATQYHTRTLDQREHYAAFTSAELGQALGEGFETFISLKDWCCRGKRPLICYGSTEAQARAKMLIECLESGLMTAAEVNERLNDTK